MENVRRPVKAACAMCDDRISAGAMTSPTDRERRLAEALRENLRRRKAQAREKEAPAPDEPETDGRDQSGPVA
jgi:hypothetical protein